MKNSPMFTKTSPTNTQPTEMAASKAWFARLLASTLNSVTSERARIRSLTMSSVVVPSSSHQATHQDAQRKHSQTGNRRQVANLLLQEVTQLLELGALFRGQC